MSQSTDRYYQAINCIESGDYQRGIPLMESLAQAGSDSAQHSMGYCYEEGLGVQKDLVQAIYWYTLAAKQGNPMSQTNLGCIYLEGVNGQVNYRQAFNLLYETTPLPSTTWRVCLATH